MIGLPFDACGAVAQPVKLLGVSETAFLSLGSNIGDRLANLGSAIQRLAEAGKVRAASGFYETEPVDVLAQPWFVNCVVALETDRPPRELLELALSIEESMGRRRTSERGPRLIDLDILLIGDRVIDEPGLKVPHPAMHERRFVLVPLADIAPDALHPVLKKTAIEMLAQLPPGQLVQRLDPEIASPKRKEPSRL